MKKISCDIIRDILPLYLDDVVSADTKELVEEHLEACDSCKKEADILKKKITLPTNINIGLSDAKVVKGLKNRLLKKKVVISIISMVAAVAIVTGIYMFLTLTESYIPYDSAYIQLEEEEGYLYARYSGDHLAGIVSLGENTVTIDGEEKNVAILGCTETLWTKYVRPIFKRPQKESGVCGLGNSAEIDQVYYAEFNLHAYLDSCNYSTPPEEWDYEYIIEHSRKVWGE